MKCGDSLVWTRSDLGCRSFYLSMYRSGLNIQIVVKGIGGRGSEWDGTVECVERLARTKSVI